MKRHTREVIIELGGGIVVLTFALLMLCVVALVGVTLVKATVAMWSL